MCHTIEKAINYIHNMDVLWRKSPCKQPIYCPTATK